MGVSVCTCGVCAQSVVSVHIQARICQGTPFSACLMSVCVSLSRRVHTGVRTVCVRVLMGLCVPHVHITVPGGHPPSNLNQEAGFSSSKAWGQELGLQSQRCGWSSFFCF